MRLAVIIALAALTCCQLFAVDEVAQLYGLSYAENSHRKIGKRGELGDWQMMPYNVKKYGGYQMVHALMMLRDVIEDLKNRGVDPSPFNIALAWNAGPKAASMGKAPVASYHYAAKAERRYNEIVHGPR